MSAFHILLLSRLATSQPLLSPSLREAETFAQSTAKREAETDLRKQLTMEIEYYWKGLLESVTLIVTYRTVLPRIHACFVKVTFPLNDSQLFYLPLATRCLATVSFWVSKVWGRVWRSRCPVLLQTSRSTWRSVCGILRVKSGEIDLSVICRVLKDYRAKKRHVRFRSVFKVWHL